MPILEAGESAMVNFGSICIGQCSLFERIKQAKVYISSLVHNFCPPFGVRLKPIYSPTPAFIVYAKSLIQNIFTTACLSKIRPPIVEGVMVNMVCLFLATTSEYFPRHIDSLFCSWNTIPLSVKTACSRTPLSAPVPSRKPLVIASVHDGVLALRERNKSVGWVLRLDNFVSWNTILGHVPTSNRNLLPTANLS